MGNTYKLNIILRTLLKSCVDGKTIDKALFLSVFPSFSLSLSLSLFFFLSRTLSLNKSKLKTCFIKFWMHNYLKDYSLC